MQVMQANHTISQSTIALIMKLIKKSYKEEEQQEVLNDIVAIVDEVKRDNRISAEAIREEVVKKLKGELATRDFVRAEINQVRTEIAEVSNKFNILEQKVKFYAMLSTEDDRPNSTAPDEDRNRARVEVKYTF